MIFISYKKTCIITKRPKRLQFFIISKIYI